MINQANKTHLQSTGNFRIVDGKIIFRWQAGAACGRKSTNCASLPQFMRDAKDTIQKTDCCQQCLVKLENYKTRIAALKAEK